MRADRAGALPRGGGGRCARHGYRLLLRRSGPRHARVDRHDLAEPLSLLDGNAGGRWTAHHRTWISGGLVAGNLSRMRNALGLAGLVIVAVVAPAPAMRQVQRTDVAIEEATVAQLQQ